MSRPPSPIEEILEAYREASFTKNWFEKDLKDWKIKYNEVHEQKLTEATAALLEYIDSVGTYPFSVGIKQPFYLRGSGARCGGAATVSS